MSAHRYKVAAILLLAPSISGIGVTGPASADEQSAGGIIKAASDISGDVGGARVRRHEP